jgi:hypothetical protein
MSSRRCINCARSASQSDVRWVADNIEVGSTSSLTEVMGGDAVPNEDRSKERVL